MLDSRLIDLYIKVTSPKIFHVGGTYVRTDPIDIALLDTRLSKEDMKDAILSCTKHIANSGHIFIQSSDYDDVILECVNTQANVKALAVNTQPENTRIICKDIGSTDAILTFDPAILPWVHQECCTLPVARPVDLVYTLADQPEDYPCDELILSLRSACAHCSNMGNVWIVSKNLPDSMSEVNHIRCCDTYNNCKDANIINKVLAACVSPDVSSRFIFMSDDQIFNHDIDLRALVPTYNPRGIQEFQERAHKNKWTNRMINTLNIVKSLGGSDDINWDSHVPQPMDKDRFRDIMLSIPYTTLPGVCINTAYFGIKLESPMICQSDIKDTFESECAHPIQATKPIIGFNDKGYNTGLKEYLFELFPDKCKYEKDYK